MSVTMDHTDSPSASHSKNLLGAFSEQAWQRGLSPATGQGKFFCGAKKELPAKKKKNEGVRCFFLVGMISH